MASNGQFVVDENGNFGLLAAGTFAVYDSAGECSDCCGPACECPAPGIGDVISINETFSSPTLTSPPWTENASSSGITSGGVSGGEYVFSATQEDVLPSFAELISSAVHHGTSCVNTFSFSCDITLLVMPDDSHNGLLEITLDMSEVTGSPYIIKFRHGVNYDENPAVTEIKYDNAASTHSISNYQDGTQFNLSMDMTPTNTNPSGVTDGGYDVDVYIDSTLQFSFTWTGYSLCEPIRFIAKFTRGKRGSVVNHSGSYDYCKIDNVSLSWS